jgi:hypothetical protein
MVLVESGEGHSRRAQYLEVCVSSITATISSVALAFIRGTRVAHAAKLCHAARTADGRQVLRNLLLTSGVDKDKSDSDGLTPLFNACLRDHVEVAKGLTHLWSEHTIAFGAWQGGLVSAAEEAVVVEGQHAFVAVLLLLLIAARDMGRSQSRSTAPKRRPMRRDRRVCCRKSLGTAGQSLQRNSLHSSF